MTFLDRIKVNLRRMKEDSKRFPVSVVLTIILGILFIYKDGLTYDSSPYHSINKWIKVVSLGFIYSLNIGIFFEGKNKKHEYLSYGVLGLIGVFYYKFGLLEITAGAGYRYMGLVLIGFIWLTLSGWMNRKEDYEFYVLDMMASGFLTFLYSLVLYLGVMGILLTLVNLFDLNFLKDFYYYGFILISTVFAPVLFMSRIPGKDIQYTRPRLSRALEYLLVYIVIPLISVYTVILYAYFIKIIVSRNWPEGLVSHLVLWYSLISVGVLFLIDSIMDREIVRNFRRYFPMINIPLVLMMFLASYKRIGQYGITEHRYFIVIAGLWILGMNIYFIIKRVEDRRVIPITLSIVILISLYGPFNSIKLSKTSQNERFEEVLIKAGVLEDGKITRGNRVDRSEEVEINNLIHYFERNHKLDDLELLPDDFSLDDTDKLFGFVYSPFLMDTVDGKYDYINYNSDNYSNIMDISDYNYYISSTIYGDQNNIELNGVTVRNDYKKKMIRIKKNEDIINIDLKEWLNEEIKGLNRNEIENGSYIHREDGLVEYKLVLVHFHGSIENEVFNLDDAEYVLLLK